MGFVVMTAQQVPEQTITISTDFTPTPGGRFRANGENSGEEFRDSILIPALEHSKHITVYLDGAVGYAGSFLEEAFGGLVRTKKFSYEDLLKRMTVASRDARYSIYQRMVEKYMRGAADNTQQ